MGGWNFIRLVRKKRYGQSTSFFKTGATKYSSVPILAWAYLFSKGCLRVNILFYYAFSEQTIKGELILCKISDKCLGISSSFTTRVQIAGEGKQSRPPTQPTSKNWTKGIMGETCLTYGSFSHQPVGASYGFSYFVFIIVTDDFWSEYLPVNRELDFWGGSLGVRLQLKNL